MRVVVHEDHQSPVVAVHLMYHAGSRHERPGRTGLAHLLEHLLYEGSANCPKGEYDDLLERVGGSNNGSTWLDRTNYYATVPSHAVELAFWLERDRMTGFLPLLTRQTLNTQRDVVINERKQAYENRPYGLADERLQQLLFPPEHPYSWPTIGYTADLRATTLADVESFYKTFYAANNAVLVVAGDVETPAALRLAERYFGDLPAGPLVPFSAAVAPEMRPGRAVLHDHVSFSRVYLGWAVPGYGTAEWVALDVLAYVLADGDSSRLQRRLVREGQLAQDVDSYLYPTELHGIFGVVATARAGVTPEALHDAVTETLHEVVTEGVPESEVEGALRRVRRDHLSSLADVESRAEELAYATTVLGSADALEELLDRYIVVTPPDVRRVAAEFLTPAASAAVVVMPAAEEVDDER